MDRAWGVGRLAHLEDCRAADVSETVRTTEPHTARGGAPKAPFLTQGLGLAQTATRGTCREGGSGMGERAWHSCRWLNIKNG